MRCEPVGVMKARVGSGRGAHAEHGLQLCMHLGDDVITYTGLKSPWSMPPLPPPPHPGPPLLPSPHNPPRVLQAQFCPALAPLTLTPTPYTLASGTSLPSSCFPSTPASGTSLPSPTPSWACLVPRLVATCCPSRHAMPTWSSTPTRGCTASACLLPPACLLGCTAASYNYSKIQLPVLSRYCLLEMLTPPPSPPPPRLLPLGPPPPCYCLLPLAPPPPACCCCCRHQGWRHRSCLLRGHHHTLRADTARGPVRPARAFL